MAEPCIHDLHPATCSVCNGAEKRAAEDESGRGPWFTARYDGLCAGCGDEISPGDTIRSESGHGGWLCEVCGRG